MASDDMSYNAILDPAESEVKKLFLRNGVGGCVEVCVERALLPAGFAVMQASGQECPLHTGKREEIWQP
jgi:hypothetical protein